MKTIISIVPRLPPIVDGVGDYASLLAISLKINFCISTQFIACDPQKPVEAGNDKLSPIQLPDRTAPALLAILEQYGELDTILLHYVGYGYAKRGCPVWLVEALKKWRSFKNNRRLIIIFHEVYATSSSPWNSQFWTSPLQQKIAKDLVRICDRAITSNQIFANLITNFDPQRFNQIPIIPVFSNIGEPTDLLPLNQRQPWLVTFGNASLRQRIYTHHLDQLTDICHQLGIQEIYDIGANSTEIVRQVPQVKVNSMGILPATQISEIFSLAQVGFINSPVKYVGKSTIFAAYCAHKLLSVFPTENIDNNQDGIELGQHYWSIQDGKEIDLYLAQTIANNAYQWYWQHSLNVLTSSIANLLQNS
jgi:hypothetical protein